MKRKDNYIYVPTDMPLKNKQLKIVYHRKYLDKMPKSLIYKLKKALYQYILNYLSSKPIKKVTILNRANAVIIDSKYAKLYNIIANNYDEFEEKEERKANDLQYNLLTKLLKSGKLSLGLALSLFIICNDPTLVGDPEDIEYTPFSPYYTYEAEENNLELSEEEITLTNNIHLSDMISSSNANPNVSAMVYTNETISNHFLNPEKQKAFEQYVQEYAFYFNLNADYLIDVFRHATDNYSNIDAILNGDRFDLTNPETVAILYTYFFYRGPKDYLGLDLSDYGFSNRSEFVTSEEIFIIEPNWMKNHKKIDGVVKEDITLRNGLSYSEYVGRMCDLLGIPEKYKAYVLSISYAERGEVGSPLSIYSNNMGGQRKRSGDYFAFPSPEGGIIAFVLNLRSYEWNFKIDDLQELGETYDGDEFVDQWVSNVANKQVKIMNNYDNYFLTEVEELAYQNNMQNLLANEDTEQEIISLSTNDSKALVLEDYSSLYE